MSKFTAENTMIVDEIDFLDVGKVALLYHQYQRPLSDRFGEFIIANGFDPQTFSWDYGTYLYDLDTANHRWYEMKHNLYHSQAQVYTMLCGISCDDVDEWLENNFEGEITDEVRRDAYTAVHKGSGNWIAEEYQYSLDAALDNLQYELA